MSDAAERQCDCPTCRMIDRAWDRLIDSQIANAPEPEELPAIDGDPQCAAGCGYPVEHPGERCGECACEDDGDLY